MKIRLGKNKVTLKKSDRLVGLKRLKSRSTGEPLMPEALKEKEKKINRLGGFEIFDIGSEKDTDTELDAIREAAEVEVGTHVYLVGENDTPFIPNGDIYITFADSVDLEEQAVVLKEFHLTLEEQRTPNKVFASITTESMNPIKVAFFLEKSSLVKTAYADVDSVLQEYEITVKEELLPHQWHLKSTPTITHSDGIEQKINPEAHMSVIDAWKRLGNKGSSDITIAIVDTGFDLEHSDLKGNIVHPYDVVRDKPYSKEHDVSTSGHGTSCAGLALARENTLGTIGVAPNSKFMPLAGFGYGIDYAKKIFKHCNENGADIISCSWGSIESAHELSTEHEEYIKQIATEGRNGKGCIILFAAGNEDKDKVNVFARHPDVICVGASNSEDHHSSYSNRGYQIDIVAPSNGGNWPLIAPRASGTNSHWFSPTEIAAGYKHFGGTSASTPLVAGVCALILSVNPEFTAREVKDILISTADKIGYPTYINGHSRLYGYGRVNADRAVAEAQRRLDLGNQANLEEQVGSGKGFFRFNATPQPTFGFGVQIGTFAQYGNVLIQVGKLQNIFDQPIMVNINELDGKTVYKVSIGQLTSRQEAADLLEKIRERGFNGFVSDYTNLA